MTQPRKSRVPWVKFYPDDYIGGTNFLPLEARGAFWQLCALQAAGHKLPNNFDQLCIACPGLNNAIWVLIRDKFEVLEDDSGEQYLANPRMTDEREKAEKEARNNREAVRKSRAKSQNCNRNVSITKPAQNQNQNQSQNQTQNQNPPPQKPPKGGQGEGVLSSQGVKPSQILCEWLQYFRSAGGRYDIGKASEAKLGRVMGKMDPDDVQLMFQALEEERVNNLNKDKRWQDPVARIIAEAKNFQAVN
tara:strand:- start:4189 stop:4929 length:741 start_codon:yes stop_codon:yes gene_type:complete